MNPGVHLITIAFSIENSDQGLFIWPLHVVNDNSYCRALLHTRSLRLREFSTGLKLRTIIKNMEILQPMDIFGIPQDLERLLHRLKLQD